ncbi:MAG: hypothetical protein QOF37_757 [Thermoleophilaceae bacterium]|nr:hypothetical protein [Thermoleophilaceae bacterium]
MLAFLALIAVAVLWFLWSLFQPFHGDGSGKLTVTVPNNSSVGAVADLLQSKGVVASSFFFQARATLAGHRGDLKSGTYAMKHDMSYAAAIDELTKSPVATNIVSLVVPEGESRREIASSIKSLKGDYMAATRRSPLLNPARYGAKGARDLEGFLFPATYQLKAGQNVKALVNKQLTTFKQRFATINLRAARRVNLTAYDVLTIASLVERETASPHERGLVASVIYNRLKNSTPLGIDATSRFQYNDWVHPLTRSQLASPSGYNTRIHRGLPPGPIGNPGLASLLAAARPPKTSYLYYVADCAHPGRHVFLRTLDQFNAAVARYDQARQKAGGNAPKHC